MALALDSKYILDTLVFQWENLASEDEVFALAARTCVLCCTRFGGPNDPNIISLLGDLETILLRETGIASAFNVVQKLKALS